MIKVKTFVNELKIFHALKELMELDEKASRFIVDHTIAKVIALNDLITPQDSRIPIGLIETLTLSRIGMKTDSQKQGDDARNIGWPTIFNYVYSYPGDTIWVKSGFFD